jgi:protein-ribulosamine 3-kinase
MTRSEIIDAAVRAGLGSAETFRASGDHLTNTNTGKVYIAKLGRNVEQLLGEAEGLKRMGATAPGLVPTLHIAEALQDGSGRAVFISDYIELGGKSASSMTLLAEKLANELHNPDKQLKDIQGFGFPVPTHCGVTEQDNTWE